MEAGKLSSSKLGLAPTGKAPPYHGAHPEQTVTRGGTVSGEVEVETAEITGDFDGKLTVSNRLVVHSTGRVTGTVRYLAVEIEASGQISGHVQVTDEGLTGSAKTGSKLDSDSSEKLEAAS